MHIYGNVAEYNPFHKGHKYQLEKARELGATHIVCVMSGDTVQRGDVGIFSKYERAKSAVENGADLVLELPAPFSCSNGEVFARSAVTILGGLGENVVEKIFFGCEEDNREKLIKAAELSDNLKSDNMGKASVKVRELLSKGYSYPRAMAECAEQYGQYGEIFGGANNVLGMEYINACKKIAPWIEPLPIKRKGNGHNETIGGDMPSGTFLRNEICAERNCSDFLPYKYRESPSFLVNADREIMYILCSADISRIKNLPDTDENLLNRYFQAVNSGVSSVQEFAMKIKSKNITLSRIRRMIIHTVLGVKSSDIKSPPYARILAFNERGTEILKLLKQRACLPVDSSLKRLEQTSDFAKRISHLEQNGVRLREICLKDFSGFSNEYTRKITMTKSC